MSFYDYFNSSDLGSGDGNFNSTLPIYPVIPTQWVHGSEPSYDVALVAVRIFICISGLIGNLLVLCLIIILQEYRKTVTNWYVLQLAIADSIFLLSLPFSVVEEIQNEWIFSEEMCRAKETILFVNYFASIMFLMVMSVDRYVAVCYPMSGVKFHTRKTALMITFLIWVLALLMSIPVMLYSTKQGIAPNCRCGYKFPEPKKSAQVYCGEDEQYTGVDLENCIKDYNTKPASSCIDAGVFGFDFEQDLLNLTMAGSGIGIADGGHDNSGVEAETLSDQCQYWGQGWFYKGYLVFNFVFMFIFPFLVMIFCYTKIALKINVSGQKFRSESGSNAPLSKVNHKSKRPRHRTKSAAATKASSNRSRVTIMCAVMVLLFCVCWLPFHSVHMAKIHGMMVGAKYERLCTFLPTATSLIAFMNSAINPFVYNFLGTRFFKRFRPLYKSLFRRASTAMSHMIRSSFSGYRAQSKRKHSLSSSNATGSTKMARSTVINATAL